jgi:hypothetical protein
LHRVFFNFRSRYLDDITSVIENLVDHRVHHVFGVPMPVLKVKKVSLSLFSVYFQLQSRL